MRKYKCLHVAILHQEASENVCCDDLQRKAKKKYCDYDPSPHPWGSWLKTHKLKPHIFFVLTASPIVHDEVGTLHTY